MSQETIFSFNAETGKCVVYGRGPVNNPVWQTDKLSFAEAHELANVITATYEQGVERGKQEAAAHVRAALTTTGNPHG